MVKVKARSSFLQGVQPHYAKSVMLSLHFEKMGKLHAILSSGDAVKSK